MPAPCTLDPSTSIAAYFGAELRKYRLRAGLTQVGLGTIVFCTGSLIGAIENARKPPTKELTASLDVALGAEGALTGMWPLVHRECFPVWSRAYMDAEAEATAIASYEPLVVSGLLQTPDYTRELMMNSRLDGGVERVEQALAGRMERKAVLNKPDPPHFWLIQYEPSLRCPIGGPRVHAEQLDVLIEAAQRPHIDVQVLPLAAGAHAGLAGPIFVVETAHQPKFAYSESRTSAEVVTEPRAVAEWRRAFDSLRAAALAPDASLELIRAIKEEIEP